MAGNEEELIVILGGPKPTPLAPLSDYDAVRQSLDAAEANGSPIKLIYTGAS